jgi:hypothetical protein
VGWLGQTAGARWPLLLGGLATLLCGVLALPALSRIDRRLAAEGGPVRSSERAPGLTVPRQAPAGHGPAGAR